MFQPLLTIKVPNQGKVTVGATSTTILSPNSGRTQLWLSNPSDESISVKFGAAAVLSEGIVIPAGGGIVVDTTINTLGVFGICASGSKTIAYCEVTN